MRHPNILLFRKFQLYAIANKGKGEENGFEDIDNASGQDSKGTGIQPIEMEYKSRVCEQWSDGEQNYQQGRLPGEYISGAP